ncbi:hypothetical protein XI07_13160 [Bradyrhizobium sp. CCBAU 11445]|uniref:hypothetical protein n=1 Tax=Bradyrhizobium sp. CCBAU 11445 TaxID=1630896 RepID=UPI002306562E|nr:hypothetical protein [Bradyrhizobium sp. CCBAU 11445]MDA9482961.1 hypothetical protein [Bradyrhizobium sp. CCBAU 11445]
MTVAEVKFRAEQNDAAKARLHADMAALSAGGPPSPVKKPLADPKRFIGASFARNEWSYTMNPGETITDVKSDGFFKGLASKFTMGDLVEVRSADLTFWSLLMVVASDHVAARVELRTLIETEVEAAETKDFEADGYTIENTGDVLRRLAVVRKADGKLMKDGFKTKPDAAHYIATELQARAVAS